MWKNEDVGACPCYPTQKLLETLGKAIDEVINLNVSGWFLELGLGPRDMFESVDKIMESAGFKKIGKGLTRLIYEFKDDKGCDCVVKIAKSKDLEFREPNYREVEVMNEVPDDIRDFFLPLGAVDEQSWWVTQPKAEIPEDYELRYELADELESKLKDKGWRCLDLHGNNVGLYVDKPVILDYGRGLKCRRTRRR